MKRGFTLVELVVTLFVLALAVGVAAPSIRLTADVLPSAVEAVIEAGDAISRQLGYVRPARRALSAARGA